MQDAGSTRIRAAARRNRSGAGLPLGTSLAENKRGSKKRNSPAASRPARSRSWGDDDATAFGPRTQVRAWATWGSARSSVRKRRKVSTEIADAKFGGSFLPVAVSIDANTSAARR